MATTPAPNAFQTSSRFVRRVNRGGKITYETAEGAPAPGDYQEKTFSDGRTENSGYIRNFDEARKLVDGGDGATPPSAPQVQGMGETRRRTPAAAMREGQRILEKAERRAMREADREQSNRDSRTLANVADQKGAVGIQAPSRSMSPADRDKYDRQVSGQAKNADKREAPKPRLNRQSNPNKRPVGMVTKVETTDGVTLWDKKNREDDDMTGKERRNSVESRRVAANDSFGLSHNVRRSLGADGQIRTTTDGGPTVTKNKNGSQTASGIYGTVTATPQTNKRNEARAVMTSPKTQTNTGNGPVKKGMTDSYVAPNPMDIKYTDQSLTSRANRELGMTPGTGAATPAPTVPAPKPTVRLPRSPANAPAQTPSPTMAGRSPRSPANQPQTVASPQSTGSTTGRAGSANIRPPDAFATTKKPVIAKR